MTPAAILRSIGRVDSHVSSASFFRFAGQFAEKRRPTGVMNALGQTMVVNHPIDVEVFDTDETIGVDNTTAPLMGEVIPFEGDALMHTGNRFAMLAPLWCAFRQFGVLTLDFGQGFLFLAEKARVVNFLPIGEGSKRLQPHVNPDLSRVLSKLLRFALHREGSIPLAGAALADGEGFDLAPDLAVIDHLDGSHFGNHDPVVMRDAETGLGESETVIAVTPSETRIAGLLTRLDSSEEGFERQIDANGYILQDLRMHFVEGRTILFQRRKRVDLPIAGERLSVLLIGRFAFLQQVIIEPMAFIENVIQGSGLLLRWVYAVLKHLMHIVIIAQTGQEGTVETALLLPQTRNGALIPRMNDGGFPAPVVIKKRELFLLSRCSVKRHGPNVQMTDVNNRALPSHLILRK
jgi:hypothetical protein